jgi:uncharacterized protein (TIGR03437 family)
VIFIAEQSRALPRKGGRFDQFHVLSVIRHWRIAIKATLGGVPCEVQFAGLAPGFAGLYQVNFRVPVGAASGSQDVVVIANGVPSPGGAR